MGHLLGRGRGTAPPREQTTAGQGNLRWGQTPLLSKWGEKDHFQAVLTGQDQVTLTTYRYGKNYQLHDLVEAATKKGTFWDFEEVHLGQVWTAQIHIEPIRGVHRRMIKLKINKWIGRGVTVTSPANTLLPQLSPDRHKAFIMVASEMYLTTIAPPLWVWTDPFKLSGAWCLVVTTYVDYWDDYQPQTEHIYTCLVPVSTLDHSTFTAFH